MTKEKLSQEQAETEIEGIAKLKNPLKIDEALKKLKEDSGIKLPLLKKQLKYQKEKINQSTKELLQETNTKEEPKISYPKISLEEYRKKLHDWFHFVDDEIVDVQLATLIAEKIPGDPLWMFIIAPPGALKTENLRSFETGDDFFHLSNLTSKTFVSGLMISEGESRGKVEDLLPQLVGKVLIFKDFTTILEKNSDERAEIFAQLREIYDGSFAKKVGTIDKAIRYDSRFG